MTPRDAESVRAALFEVFGYHQFQYLNNDDLDAKIERLAALLNDGSDGGR